MRGYARLSMYIATTRTEILCFARVVIPDIVVMRFPFCTSLMDMIMSV